MIPVSASLDTILRQPIMRKLPVELPLQATLMWHPSWEFLTHVYVASLEAAFDGLLQTMIYIS